MPRIDGLVVGDPGRLRQVLNNLLSNAVKFTREGVVALRTEILDHSRSQATVRFAVRDSGIGIDPVNQRKLFQNFVQGDDSMTRKYGGTGLGLAISKQLVELMKGRISLESTPGAGSTFSFTVKFGRQAAEAAVCHEDADLEGLRVLVVDSKGGAAPIVNQLLPSWGCRVEALHHGDLVVPTLKKEAEQQPFRIALIDLDLAEQDGLAVETDIKPDAVIGRTLLIAMTSSPMRGDGLRVHRSGYSGYLVKPFDPEELRGVMREVLRSANRLDPPLVTRHTLIEQREMDGGNSLPRNGNKPQAPVPASATEPEVPDTPKRRALIAEDNLVNQKIAARLLRRVGLDVDVVDNGSEAVQAWESGNYDLILMDCQMPEMDGFEATERIRRQENNGRRTPICALTAHAMKADRDKCLAAGMDDYLTKPVDVEKLREIVERLVPPKGGEEKAATATGD